MDTPMGWHTQRATDLISWSTTATGAIDHIVIGVITALLHDITDTTTILVIEVTTIPTVADIMIPITITIIQTGQELYFDLDSKSIYKLVFRREAGLLN